MGMGEETDKVNGLAALVARGVRLHDAAARMGLLPDQAAEIALAADFQERVRQFLPSDADIRQQFMGEASRSLEVLRELRDHSTDGKVRLAAVKDLLDRAGFTPVRRIQTMAYTIDPERHKLLQATAKETLDG